MGEGRRARREVAPPLDGERISFAVGGGPGEAGERIDRFLAEPTAVALDDAEVNGLHETTS